MTFPDGGGGEGYDPGAARDWSEGGMTFPDDGGDEGYVPDGDDDNPGLDEGGGDEDNPVTTKAPPVSSSKLPNTGSTLMLYAGIGIGVIALALVARRVVARRSR